jgi:LysM repeat protein
MKHKLVFAALCILALALALPLAANVSAAGPEWVVVSPGETLTMLAQRYGVSVQALIHVNNLPNENFVYSGQRLLIPDPLMVFAERPQQEQPTQSVIDSAPSPVIEQPAAAPQSVESVYYTVGPGDTLAAIAQRFGISVAAIAEANNLTNWNFVWYGQRLRIPGTGNINGVNPPPAPLSAQQPAPIPPGAPTSGKWIDVNVSNQTITAYDGTTPLKTVVVSTGVPRTPTVLGTYKIQRKYPAVRMTGGTPGIDYYDLPNVPYTMFFYQGYAIHGTYWHNKFGQPMSHGCVNLPTDEAKWFYEWAEVGTPVVSRK